MAARTKVKPVSGAVQLLEKQIATADPGIRKTGVNSTPKLRAPTTQIVDACDRAFKHENWYAKRTASDVLAMSVLHGKGCETGYGATKLAGNLMDDEDPEVRRCMARALLLIAHQPKEEAPKQLLPGQTWTALEAEDQTSVDELSKDAALQIANKLTNRDADVRDNAVLALSSLESWATPHTKKLVQLIGDPEIFVRHGVIRAVDKLGALCSSVSDEMGKFLEHDDEAVRYTAKSCLLALAKYDGKAASKGTVKFIKSTNVRTRLAAMQLLMELKGYAASHSEAIAELLGDQDVNVRAMVPRILVAAATKKEEKKVGKSLKVIQNRMDNKDQDIARGAVACMRALSFISSKFARSQGRCFLEDMADMDPETVTRKRMQAIEVLGGAGENAQPYLDEMIVQIESKDWRLRRAVAHCLEDLKEAGTGQGAKEVAKRLLHAEPDVRRAAAECVGRMGIHAGRYGQRVEAALATEEDEDVKSVLEVACARLEACGILAMDFEEDGSPKSPGSPGPGKR